MSQSNKPSELPDEKKKLSVEETELSEQDLETVSGGVLGTRGSDTCAAVNGHIVKVTVGGAKDHG